MGWHPRDGVEGERGCVHGVAHLAGLVLGHGKDRVDRRSVNVVLCCVVDLDAVEEEDPFAESYVTAGVALVAVEAEILATALGHLFGRQAPLGTLGASR